MRRFLYSYDLDVSRFLKNDSIDGKLYDTYESSFKQKGNFIPKVQDQH